MLSIFVMVSSLISFFASLLPFIGDAIQVTLSMSWWKRRGTEAIPSNVLPMHLLDTVTVVLPTIPSQAYVGGRSQAQRPDAAVNQSTRPGSSVASVRVVSTSTIPATTVTVYPLHDDVPHYHYKPTAADFVHPRAARTASLFPTRSRAVHLSGPYRPSVATPPVRILANDDVVVSADKPATGLAVIREEDCHARDVKVQMTTPECSSRCIDVQPSQDDRACAQKSGTPGLLSSLGNTQADVRAEVSEDSEDALQLSPCPPLGTLKDHVAFSLAALRSADLPQSDRFAFDFPSSPTSFSTSHEDIIKDLPLNDAMLFAPFMTLRHESSPGRNLERATDGPNTINTSGASPSASATGFLDELLSSSTPPDGVDSVVSSGHSDAPSIHASGSAKDDAPGPTASPTSISPPSGPAIQTILDSSARCLTGLDVLGPTIPSPRDPGDHKSVTVPPRGVGCAGADVVSPTVVPVESRPIVNAWLAVALPGGNIDTSEDAMESRAGSPESQPLPSPEPVSSVGGLGDRRRVLCATNNDVWFVGNTERRISKGLPGVGDRSQTAFQSGVTGLGGSAPPRSANAGQSPDVPSHPRPLLPSRLHAASSLLYNPSASSAASSANLPNQVDTLTPSVPPLPVMAPLTPAALTPVAATQARSTITVAFNDGKEPMDCQARVDAYKLISGMLPKESVHRSIKCELLGKGAFGSVRRHEERNGKTVVRVSAVKKCKWSNGARKRNPSQQAQRRLMARWETRSGATYIRTDFIDGFSLGDWVMWSSGAFWNNPAPVAALLYQVNQGLLELRSCGVTHADIKPGNIMVRRDGLVVLVDFGFSHIGDAIFRLGGTEDFVPREARRQQDAIHASRDVFAVGVTMDAILDVKCMNDFVQDWEIGLVKIVESCCDVDHTKRPTPSEIHTKLSEACHQHGGATESGSRHVIMCQLEADGPVKPSGVRRALKAAKRGVCKLPFLRRFKDSSD
ncbi:hypothetical protein FRB96_003076 [Tulasnella sp. 330]|nr:hypothetical protein FRB96_003076 [Tulasnella sp. 330]